MPWAGIDNCIEALGRMKVRVREETAEAAVAGAQIIKNRAKANILSRFTMRTWDLFNSMYSDPVARMVGPDEYTARAFPRGSRTYKSDATPYGRIQELGGIIHGDFGKNEMLWFISPEKGHLISVPEVELEGKFYLRDAVLASAGALRDTAADHWRRALEE
jgi:hypothetical protein